MADIALTAARVETNRSKEGLIWPLLAEATITVGQLVYITATGGVGVADGNGSGTTAPIGVALTGGGAGQEIDVLVRGELEGFTIASLAYYDPIYMSDTAGALSTTAGSTSVVVGRVFARADSDKTKFIYINCTARF